MSDVGRVVTQIETPQKIGISKALDSYFQISQKGSDIRTELFAGLSTFLSLSYIFIVNPAILSKAGIDPSVSLFATLAISAAATLVMGLWAKLPFVVSTGLEMNGYVTYFAVAGLGFSWQQALGMVFWSSILMVLLTVTSVREKIIDSIPGYVAARGGFPIIKDGMVLGGIGISGANQEIDGDVAEAALRAIGL